MTERARGLYYYKEHTDGLGQAQNDRLEYEASIEGNENNKQRSIDCAIVVRLPKRRNKLTVMGR